MCFETLEQSLGWTLKMTDHPFIIFRSVSYIFILYMDSKVSVDVMTYQMFIIIMMFL